MRRKPGVKPAKPKGEPQGERVKNRTHGHSARPAELLLQADPWAFLPCLEKAEAPWLGGPRGSRLKPSAKEMCFGKKALLCFPIIPSLVRNDTMECRVNIQMGFLGRGWEERERATGFWFMKNSWCFKIFLFLEKRSQKRTT